MTLREGEQVCKVLNLMLERAGLDQGTTDRITNIVFEFHEQFPNLNWIWDVDRNFTVEQAGQWERNS